MYCLQTNLILLGLLDPEEEGVTILRNVWHYSPNDTVSHHRRSESLAFAYLPLGVTGYVATERVICRVSELHLVMVFIFAATKYFAEPRTWTDSLEPPKQWKMETNFGT